MIKVYLDWNIMSSMKRGSFLELKSFLNNKEKFLLPYSTSHIGDIYASRSENEIQKKIIQEDLEYITSITDNICFFGDIKGNIHLGRKNPNSLYEERIDSQNLFKDFSIDNLFSPFDDEEDKIISSLINLLKSMFKSIPLDNTFKNAFKNSETSNEMEKMFPGLKDNLTFEGWFKYFGNMYNRLNETEDYKGLREGVQKIGVNSSHFSEGKKPFEVIDEVYKKLRVNHSDFQSDNSKNAPTWFNELSNEYIRLDMHGYKQDKVKVNEKTKKTFRNTTDDAFHSAFASRCDFYITNDKKNIDKTKAVYQKFDIKTSVYTPDEFIEYYQEYLKVDTFNEHLSNLLLDSIQNGRNYHAYSNEKTDDGNITSFVGFSNYYFFDFFNKVRICKDTSDGYIFYLISKDHPSGTYYHSQKELEKLIKVFVTACGLDDHQKGEYVPGEIEGENWSGRIWTKEKLTIKIVRLNGWFQLYIYPESKKNKRYFFKIKAFLKRIFQK